MNKSIVLILISVFILLCSCSDTKSNLEQKLAGQKQTTEFRLSSITDFEWDTVSFVAPYMSKKGIEKELSITSKEITDNYFDESTVYLIFTQDSNVTYTIIGNTDNLKFDFDVGENNNVKIIPTDKCVFSVKKENEFTTFTLKE